MARDRARIERLGKRAFQFEKNHSICSQAVLAAFKEEYDFISNDLFRAGTGLAGGIGLTGDACGALIGGAMVIGAVKGRDYNNLEDRERVRYETLEMVKELTERYQQRYGCTGCFKIQEKIMGRSFNLWEAEDKEAFIEAGGHEDKCPSVCGDAARWTAEILMDRDLI